MCGTFFQTWIDGSITANDMANALGGTVDGMLAEYRILNQNGLVPMPDGLSFEEASTLPCAALTAWNSIFETGKLTKDKFVSIKLNKENKKRKMSSLSSFEITPTV